VLLRTLSHEDIEGFRGLAGKFGPMKKYANKFLDVLDKYSYN
jgi:stage V sporulation protein B